ncbi:MAG: RNA polymerase sigma-70 factor [Gemmatimonadota bacterium]|nr:MAG: RNA polymerase sigma-70 factor [Gemmatimonadota bacterium]
MGESDVALLSRIQEGDTRALEILLERYWAPVVRYVATILGSRDAAEDVAQDTFVRLWERREAWKLEGSVRALLFRMARNLSLDELRRRSAREGTLRVALDAPSLRSPDRDLESYEFRALIVKAVDSLPPRRRQVFILVRHYGLSYREAADVLDLSPQTVANHLSLALADLRESLAPHFHERSNLTRSTEGDVTGHRSA